MRKALLLFLAVSICLLCPSGAWSQYKVLHGTLANGGGVATGDHGVYLTVGEPAIGISIGADNFVKAGFWYCAGISSTVDVAFASFFAELRDDAVLLVWEASASTPVESFNVYRSEADEDAFESINPSPIPAAFGAEYLDDTVLPGRTYLYRIGAMSGGAEWRSLTVSIAIPPKPTTLYQNYPNPFNPATNIAFYLPAPQQVSLVIYDVRGGTVRTLVNGARTAGRHVEQWDGRNDRGLQVGSGVYWYRLTAGKDVITKKLVILR